MSDQSTKREKRLEIPFLAALLIMLTALVAFSAYAEKGDDSDTSQDCQETEKKDPGSMPMNKNVERTDEQWKEILTPEQYRILRGNGTEAAFTGEYYECKEPGIYRCAACGAPLFDSGDKYDSGSGWPSYTKPLDEGSVKLKQDKSHFMNRIEVLCERCGSHLGHVFDDGPGPDGKRFCINSGALDLDAKKSTEKPEGESKDKP